MTKEEIKRLKEATEKVTKWESSGKAFGHYEVLNSKATHQKGADHLYEFWCLMSLLKDLNVHYEVKIVKGSATDKLFPQSPAPKKGWPYFTIESKKDLTNKYQICYGTKIKLSRAPNTTIAPDISIQDWESSDDPDESMVEMILDAKFKYSESSALSIEIIHAFMQRVAALKTHDAPSLPIQFDRLVDLIGNCLLTNGRALEEHAEYCKMFAIKQIECFDDINTHRVIG